MANYIYGAIALTGGGTGALDHINGNDISDADGCIVFTGAGMYLYSCDATSGAIESSPDIIAPDDNPGTKRWILLEFRAADASCDVSSFAGLFNATHDDVQKALDVIDDLFTAGNLLKHEQGGLESDVSAANGIVKISAGSTSIVVAPLGDIVGTTQAQALTNKTIDGDDNTILDIGLASMKVVSGESNSFIVRDGVGNVVAARVVPGGDVVGTSDTQIITNKRINSPKLNEDVVLSVKSSELNQLVGVSVGGVAGGDITINGGTQTLTNKIIIPKDTTKTANYTITVNDDVVWGDTSSSGLTFTLPAASNKMTIRIAKTAVSNSLIVASGAGDTIEGDLSINIAIQYGSIILVSDGVNTWYQF